MNAKTVQKTLQEAYQSMLAHIEELVDKDKKPLKEAFNPNPQIENTTIVQIFDSTEHPKNFRLTSE